MDAFSVHTLIVLLLGFYGIHVSAGSLIREFTCPRVWPPLKPQSTQAIQAMQKFPASSVG